MVAKLKILGIADSLAHPDGGALAKVGDTITVAVSITDRSKSTGGTFRITHGGVAGDTFAFDGRIGTGEAKKLFQRKAKQAPNNYTGQDVFTFSIPITAAAALADVVLVAVTQCEVLAPDAPVQMTTLATPQEVADLMPTFLSVAPQILLGVARGGNQGLAGQAANALQSRVQFHAALFFLDPEGNERPLPDGAPIVGVVGRERRQYCETTVSSRAVAFSALATDMVLTHQVITLRIGGTGDHVVLCELPGAPSKTQTWGPLPPPSDPTGTLPNRFLTLPRMTNLLELECEVTNDDGRYDAATGLFALAKNGRPTSLGSQGSPVKIVLKPKWQFLRFEYFDRCFGVSDHGGNNVTMPAANLEGYDTIPGLPSPPAHTRSNWWLDPASDGKIVQCLPWFVQKTLDGTARARPDIQSEIVFELPANTCVKSASATERTRVIATPLELAPGNERLKLYDLPRKWKARNYYGAISTTAGEFGWYQDIATKPTAVDRPIVFCLDDLVLTDSDGKMLDDWTHDERLAIFANTFDDTVADCSVNGLYKSDVADKKPWLSKAPADGSPEAGWNYVHHLPKWTRLVAAGGNLFDVFDRRSVAGSPLGLDETVGARAAVRWVDATVGPMGSPAQATFNARPALQQPANGKHFALHPFFQQEFVARTNPVAPGTVIDSWSAPLPSGNGRFRNGRFDLALLRSCGVKDDKEVGALIRYHRYSFDYTSQPSTLQAGTASQHADWTRDLMVELTKRWNGADGVNAERATLQPQPDSSGPELKVVTVVQTYPRDQAHFHVKLVAESETSSMGADNGTGQLRVAAANPNTTRGFAAAHEDGHTGGLPDDYCPSTLGVPDGRSNHQPGSPYITDAQAMMKSNKQVRARYFWHMAEWLRGVSGFANAKYQIKHGASVYKLPYLPTFNASRSLVQWPVSGMTHAQPNRVGLCDTYLYLLGDDEFSRSVLTGLAGGGTFDAILVVMLVANFSSTVALSNDEWKELFTLCNQKIAGSLNNKVIASFSVKPENGPPAVTRCLVHFMPHLTKAATTAATHLEVELSHTVDLPDLDTASTPRKVVVQIDKSSTPNWNSSKNLVRDYYFDAFCSCIGVSGDDTDPRSFTNATSYKELVKSVLAAGQSPTVVRA